MLAKIGSVKAAAILFKKMLAKDVISWSSFIAYVLPMAALNPFNELLIGKPNLIQSQ